MVKLNNLVNLALGLGSTCSQPLDPQVTPDTRLVTHEMSHVNPGDLSRYQYTHQADPFGDPATIFAQMRARQASRLKAYSGRKMKLPRSNHSSDSHQDLVNQLKNLRNTESKTGHHDQEFKSGHPGKNSHSDLRVREPKRLTEEINRELAQQAQQAEAEASGNGPQLGGAMEEVEHAPRNAPRGERIRLRHFSPASYEATASTELEPGTRTFMTPVVDEACQISWQQSRVQSSQLENLWETYRQIQANSELNPADGRYYLKSGVNLEELKRQYMIASKDESLEPALENLANVAEDFGPRSFPNPVTVATYSDEGLAAAGLAGGVEGGEVASEEAAEGGSVLAEIMEGVVVGAEAI